MQLALWVVIRHFSYPSRVALAGGPADTQLVRYLDNVLGRTGVVINAFVVTAGFGMHLSQASRGLLTVAMSRSWWHGHNVTVMV